ncbi:MAG: hemolysin family protein [Silicimonas sp.]|nr:hemolysin family protein [Silicimonas sp.]
MGENGEASSNAAHGAQQKDTAKQGLLTRLFGARDTQAGDAPTVAPDGARHSGGLGNLTRLRVEDVMIPKVEVVAVPSDITKSELVEVFRDSGLTRLPVFEDTLDTPKGMIHLKDFTLKHGFDCEDETFSLKSMLRPLLYAPPSMPIGVLLQKMQSDRMHMALVIDEYGGVDGLVTIEDLIEQVIGEIEDEHDVNDGDSFIEEAPGCFLAKSRTPIEEFEAEIGQRLRFGDDPEEIDTLGGLVFMLAGRVPARGEVVKHPDGLDFEVVDADPRRIKRLRVRTNMAKAAQ